MGFHFAQRDPCQIRELPLPILKLKNNTPPNLSQAGPEGSSIPAGRSAIPRGDAGETLPSPAQTWAPHLPKGSRRQLDAVADPAQRGSCSQRQVRVLARPERGRWACWKWHHAELSEGPHPSRKRRATGLRNRRHNASKSWLTQELAQEPNKPGAEGHKGVRAPDTQNGLECREG